VSDEKASWTPGVTSPLNPEAKTWPASSIGTGSPPAGTRVAVMVSVSTMPAEPLVVGTTTSKYREVQVVTSTRAE
jgi:hypothetical protein